MPKWMWALFLGLVTFGLILIVQSGIKPRSVKVLKPSFFQDPREIGQVLHKVLRPRLVNHPLMVFGGAPGSSTHLQIFEGFARAATEGSAPQFDRILIGQISGSAEGIGQLPIPATIMGQYGMDLQSEVLSAIKKGERVLVYTNSLDTPRFDRKSLTSEVEQSANVKAMAVSWLELPGPDNREAQVMCLRDPNKYNHSLGCLLEETNEAALRNRKIKWDKYVGIINLEGERDYVGYSHAPLVPVGN